MGNLRITSNELLYHRQQFYENLRVHGLPCTIYPIVRDYEEAYDFYNDIESSLESFEAPINTFMTYEELPTIKTLRSLGWYVEEETLPAVGYVPVLYMNDQGGMEAFSPGKDDKISLTANPIDENSSTRWFLIKDFIGNGFPNVVYYTCKLVPYYKEKITSVP